MKKINLKLLSDLKKIAAHFKLNLSKTDFIRKVALALDTKKHKLLIIDETDKPFFKTVDLQNVDACTLKVDYKNINAGDLEDQNMDHFIDRVQLHILHIDPQKSVSINFYDTTLNNENDRERLVDKANEWKNVISKIVRPKQLVRA